MLLLALTALEKASQIPSAFWIKVAAGVAAFVVAIILLRKLLEVNKFLLIIVGFIGFSVLWFQWIYERNEPAFMTPVIEPIAQFFPSKGAYEVKQQNDPGKPGLNKSGSSKPTPTPARR